MPCFPSADPQIVVERLPRDLCQFKPDGAARLSLAHVCAVDRVAVGRHVVNAKRYKIAAPQLAVDGKIEEDQVACTPF